MRSAEIKPGVFKPVDQCTPPEKQNAIRIAEMKIALARHWTFLLDELGADWIPQTPFGMRMMACAGDVPRELPVAELIADIEKLEAVLEMKRQCAGSDN